MCLAFPFILFDLSHSAHFFRFPLRIMQIESMEYEESPTTKYEIRMY